MGAGASWMNGSGKSGPKPGLLLGSLSPQLLLENPTGSTGKELLLMLLFFVFPLPQ